MNDSNFIKNYLSLYKQLFSTENFEKNYNYIFERDN